MLKSSGYAVYDIEVSSLLQHPLISLDIGTEQGRPNRSHCRHMVPKPEQGAQPPYPLFTVTTACSLLPVFQNSV